MPHIFLSYKKEIDAFLTAYLRSKQSAAGAFAPFGPDAVERLLAYAVSGKSIRGGLLLWASEAYGYERHGAAVQAAGALELLHSGLLVHDDIMDADEMRRGNKSIHIQYTDSLNGRQEPVRNAYGESMAICVGDMAFFLAAGCLAQIDNMNLSALIAEEFFRVCGAQMLDVSFAVRPDIPSETDVLRMYEGKTGRYTFAVPLLAGALLGGASARDAALLTRIGTDAGILFQIRDDELNVFGNQNSTGKPVSSDIREAKKTILMSILWQAASTAEKEELHSIFSPPLSFSAQQRVYDLFASHHVCETVARKEEALLKGTIPNVKKLGISAEKKQELAELIQFVYTRNM